MTLKQVMLTPAFDAYLFVVCDSGFADWVRLVHDRGGVVREAPLPPSPLVLQRHREAASAPLVALGKARKDHPNVPALNDLLLLAAVISKVHHLLVGEGASTAATVGRVAPVIAVTVSIAVPVAAAVSLSVPVAIPVSVSSVVAFSLSVAEFIVGVLVVVASVVVAIQGAGIVVVALKEAFSVMTHYFRQPG
jgi:hypothetical protein